MGWPQMPSRFDKTCTFTVPADREQAGRWEAAASLEGQGVGSWLASTADTYLKERARRDREPSLPWFTNYFRVFLSDGEYEVRGIASGPFGIFRGDRRGLGEPGSGRHSLVHRPCRRIIDTLPLRKACMALAAELSTLEVNWQETDPEKVLVGAPDQEKAQKLLRLFEKLTYPS
jgi:hypothetical protein